MKAEHRKELETNTLADKMGHALKRVQSGRRSTFLTSVLVVAALLVGSWFLYAYISGDRQERSNTWLLLDDGGEKNLEHLIRSDPKSPAGKAARLQIAWFLYWEMGVSLIGSDSNGAMQRLKIAGDEYRKIAEECEDDPLYLPQALLGVAVVEESKAIQDPVFLEKALEAYKVVVEKHESRYKNTAEGKYAQDRIDQLKDAKKRGEIAALYGEMQRDFRIRVVQPPGAGGMPPLDFLPPLEKK